MERERKRNFGKEGEINRYLQASSAIATVETNLGIVVVMVMVEEAIATERNTGLSKKVCNGLE